MMVNQWCSDHQLARIEDSNPEAVHAPENGLIVKNTFFDDCASEDVCSMRRAYSEPRQGMQRAHRLRSCAADLLIGKLEGQHDSSRDEADDVSPPKSPIYWPATPEGGSSPLTQQFTGSHEATQSHRTARPTAPTLLTSSRTVPCCSMMVVATQSRPSPVALVPLPTIRSHVAPATSMPVALAHRPSGHQLQARLSYLGKPFETDTSLVADTTSPQEQASPEGTPPQSTIMPSNVEMPCKTTAIAQLQELLQTPQLSLRFRYPAGTQVLQWTYRQRNTNRCFFRAIVAFLRDGVGHHMAGGWESSKKSARQTTAEATLALLRSQGQPPSLPIDVHVATDALVMTPSRDSATIPLDQDYLMELSNWFQNAAGGDHMVSKPVWRCERGMGAQGWKAQVQLSLQSVRHTFSGPQCASQEEAKNELACRVLWYLGSEHMLHDRSDGAINSTDLYAPDCEALLAAECRVKAPPAHWVEALAAEMILT